MRLIGITGGIGSGKSVVSRVLRTRGFMVYDCDYEARRIMDTNGELKQLILKRLGKECIATDGSLQRAIIAEKIFSCFQDRLWLNSLVHGLVIQDLKRIMRENETSRTFIFVESAILKSSGLAELCDEIWLIEASENVRLQRACMRDKVCRKDIKNRMEAQKNEYELFPDHVSVLKIANNPESSIISYLPLM